MAHHIYHTHAFILSSRPSGEANKSYALYTRELGLVYADARGVRHVRSRLRYALTDYASARVDLVRGKNIWRITSVAPAESFSNIFNNSRAVHLVARTSELVKRLCVGESAHVEIYDDMMAAFGYLNRVDVTIAEVEATELVLVLRILATLGYIGRGDTVSPYLDASFLSAPKEIPAENRKTILFEINRALRESQL